MDLFRAVVSTEEYSERVLELTEELLELNAANYTIWYVPISAFAVCLFLIVFFASYVQVVQTELSKEDEPGPERRA